MTLSSAILFQLSVSFALSPDIKANGSDGPISVSSDESLSVTLTLLPETHAGIKADWWVVQNVGGLWSYLDISQPIWSWVPGQSVTYQGELVALGTTNIPIPEGLSEGIYTFYFGMDTEMNSFIDADKLHYDHVVAHVTAPDTGLCANNATGNGNEIVSGPPGPSSNGEDRDSPFRSLTVDPSDPNIIIIGTERNGFVKSTDGGLTWVRLREGLRHSNWGYPEVYDISIPAADSNIIYAATVESPGPLNGNFPSVQAGVYKSTNGGQTWIRRNCGIENARVTMIYVDPSDPNKVTTGVSGGFPSFTGTDVDGLHFDGGILRSEDGGASWTKILIDEHDKYNEFYFIKAAASDPQNIFSFGFNFTDLSLNTGFVKSTDGGITWVQFAPELRETLISYFDVSSDGRVIYAVERDLMNIAKSIDAGSTWTKYPIGTAGYALSVSPSDADRVLYATPEKLYLSTDGLESSISVIEGLETQIEDIAFAPSNSDIVYAIQIGYILYRSDNGGESFTLVKNIRQDVLNIQP